MKYLKYMAAAVVVLVVWYVGAVSPEPKPKPVAEPQVTRTVNYATPKVDPKDFNARFVEILNVASMGKPSEVTADGYIYPLDAKGELYLSEMVNGIDDLHAVYIHVKEVRQDTVFAALAFYQAALKASTPYADPNAVFRGLGLDANLVDDLTNPKTFSIAEYTYSKKMIGKSLSLGINK